MKSFYAFQVTANEIGLPKSTATIPDAIANIFALMMGLVGSLAIIFIIVGAIQMALSAGDAGRVKRARETLTYAIVGLGVSISAYAIVEFIVRKV